MTNRLTPPDWDRYDPNMLVNVGDAKYYYENFTEVVDEQSKINVDGIDKLDGRVTALEHSTPVGPGGKGAYLNLGGTPERYPLKSEMQDPSGKETSFVVVARNDGIYFYNPSTKVLIPPKTGGGTMAIHAQFPQIFDNNHTIKYNGRVNRSGIYSAKERDLGVSDKLDLCKLMVVTHSTGEEHQTVFTTKGMSSRILPKDVQTGDWSSEVNSGPVYAGVWNPTSGAWPTHAAGNWRWDVIGDGAFGGFNWKSGDRLVHTDIDKSYHQFKTTSGVTSVNGKTGAVQLTAADVGALKHTNSVVLDCNTLVKAGSYGVTGNGSTNWCFGTTAGTIIVAPHNDTYLTQMAYSASDNKIRVRTCNKGTWTAWKKVYTEDENPTAAAVKAVDLNFGIAAAGKDSPDMDNPPIVGGMFNSNGTSIGRFSNYAPFLQSARAGGSDGTGQLMQIQGDYTSKQMAFRLRDKNVWTDWVSMYSPHNKPSAADVGAPTMGVFDGDLNLHREAGMFRLLNSFTNGPDTGPKPGYSQMLHVKGGTGSNTQWQMIGDHRGKDLWWRGYGDSETGIEDRWHKIYHAGNKPTMAELGAPAETTNKWDVRNFGVIGDGVNDDTDAFIRACNTVQGVNGTLTAPGNLRIRLVGTGRTVPVRCNMDMNNCEIDLTDFGGIVSFMRKEPETICWGAGKDPANPNAPAHPLITALQAEGTLEGGQLKGWKNIPEVEDCYFMMNTEEPLFSYRGGVKNRCEYNKVGRYGLLESHIRYPMDPSKISRIIYWPMEKQITTAQNIRWRLGENDIHSMVIRIKTSNFVGRNWRFIQENYANTLKNQTVVSVERSAYVTLEDIYFQWATRSEATTGFTYNIAINEDYNVNLKRVNGTGDGWGSTGSNNSRKVSFEKCTLSRVDFHEPMHEMLSLIDCDIGSWGVIATAMGDINIRGGSLTVKKNPYINKNGFIRSRTDAGFCDGNISIRDVTLRTDSPGLHNLFVHQNDAPEADFIVPNSPVDFAFWKNITVDNVKFEGPEGAFLNLYPVTNCRDMALSGMRWPYAVNITNCTGGNLIVDAKINNRLLPYKNVFRPENGFKEAIPNHVLNITESSVGLVDIQDSSADRRFVMQVNMDNINPTAKHDRAPDYIARFGGKFSLRNSTLNSVDFRSPLSPLMATLSGCTFVHDRLVKDDIVQGFSDNVYPAVIDSVLSTPNRPSIDSVLNCETRGNTYFVDGVELVDFDMSDVDLDDVMDAITRIDAEQEVQDVTLADHLARIEALEKEESDTAAYLKPIRDRLDVLEPQAHKIIADQAVHEDRLLGLEVQTFDHKARIEDLELNGGGGGGGGNVTEEIGLINLRLSGAEAVNTHQYSRLDALDKEHDEMQLNINNLVQNDRIQDNKLNNNLARIIALEAVGPGADVDLTPVLTRLDSVETKNADQDVSIADHKVRLDALEDAEVDLKPVTDRLDVIEPRLAVVEGNDVAFQADQEAQDVRLLALEDEDKVLTSIVNAHKVRIEALELGGGPGGTVDLTPVLTDIELLKAGHDDQNHAIGIVTDRVTDAQNVNTAQQIEIDELKNLPPSKTRFSELNDTPSGYHPGRMLAYNMAGDGLAVVDAIDTIVGMKDTPNSYTGQARKVLAVKQDESGFEYANLPNLAPLQGEINDLQNDVIVMNGVNGVQNGRLDALEAGGPGGAPTFTGLTDTPDSFTGNSHKSIRVKEDESGLEFIDSPEHAILDALEAGNLPIKWNNLKQKIAASSSNISASNIAENAFTLGLGGSADRKYILPDIVDANTSPLPANSVREGRLTIISQQGGGIRTVEVSAGCKFVMNGSASTDAPITIPPGQSWILLPAIYGNGEKTWSLIGTFSANPHTKDFLNGFNRVGSRSVYANSTFSNGQVSQTAINNSGLVSTYGATHRTISLPEIIEPTVTDWIKNHQVRVGKTYTFWGYETANMVLKPHAGQGFLVNNESTTDSRTLVPGIMETFMAVKKGDEFKWILIGRCKPDGSPVELDSVNATIAALEARIAALEANTP